MNRLIFFSILSLFCQQLFSSTFLDLCKTSSYESTLLTINSLKDIVSDIKNEKENKDDDCEQVEQKLQQLTSLDLRGLKLSDLRPLSGLTSLVALYLPNNNITDLWQLQNLPNLLILDLSNNQLSDIGALYLFSNLQTLLLDQNKIKNTLPIKDLHKLTKVSVEDNPILTNVDDEKADEIRDMFNSLMLFRSMCNFEAYAPLDLNDGIETIELLNNRARRGDLDYFRALSKDQDRMLFYFANGVYHGILQVK